MHTSLLGVKARLTKSSRFPEKEKMPTSICPECDEEVYVDADMEQGDRVNCDECQSSLVVVGLDPIELDQYEEPEKDSAGDDDFGPHDYD